MSGQLPLNPETGALCQGDIKEQTRLIVSNISHILEAGGSSLASILKTTILLTDLGNFNAVNEAYGEFFPAEPPARVCFQVAALPKGAEIEVEVVAAKEN